MPKRTSIKDISNLDDLTDLQQKVKDKRIDKRAGATKERINRHYVKVLIRYQVRNFDMKK